MVGDHFSKLTELKREETPLDDSFPYDKLFALVRKETPWHADYVNYLVTRVLTPDMNYQRKNNFFFDLKDYCWNEPLLFKRGADGFFRRCILKEKIESVMAHCHASAYGGHASTDKTVLNIFKV